MTNIKNLIKIYFKQLLTQTYNINKKSNNKRTISVVLIWALVVAAFVYYSYSIARGVQALSNSILPFAGVVTTTMFLTAFMIYELNSLMFNKKDYEILTPLPIKSKEIVIAKFITVYLFSLIATFIILLPFIVLYFIYEAINVWLVIATVIVCLILPIIINFISSLIVVLINIIANKFKNREKVSSAFQFVFLIVFLMGISVVSNELYTYILNNGINVLFAILFFYASPFHMIFASSQYLYILVYLLLGIICLALCIYILTKTYYYINEKLLNIKSNKKRKPIYFKQTKLFNVLIKNEAKRYFSCGVWVANSFIGVLIVLISSISLCIANVPEYALNMQNVLYVSVALFSLSMSATTSVSINMEGNKFVSNKSLPISFNQIVLSKITFNILLVLPFALLSVIIFSIGNFVSALTFVLLLLLVTVEVFATSFLGMFINLCLPKLNWTNEMVAVKQSGSLGLYLLIIFVLTLVPMFIFMMVDSTLLTIPLLLIEIVYLSIFGVALIVSVILLFTIGKKKYAKIS